VALEHAELLCEYRGQHHGIREIRKHLTWYCQGFPGVRSVRNRLTQVNTLDDVKQIFDELLNPDDADFAIAI
jgi:tRNA-dihydrouridine synthase